MKIWFTESWRLQASSAQQPKSGHVLAAQSFSWSIWDFKSDILKETPLTWIRIIKLWMKSGMPVNLNLGLYYDWGRIQAHILTHQEGLGEHLQTVSLTPCCPTFSSLYTKSGTFWIATANQINLIFTLKVCIGQCKACWICHLVWDWTNLGMELVC